MGGSMIKSLVLASIIYALYRFLRLLFGGRRRPANPLGIPGKVIYADDGRDSKLFINHQYGVCGKPDFILQLPNGQNASVEYKDRASKIYLSDIVQVKVAALAVRSHMPLQKAYVVTRGGAEEIPLHSDNQKLHAEVQEYIEMARRVKNGETLCVFTASTSQCNGCSVRHKCIKANRSPQ